ncbi:MAG: hypothetical protein ACYCSS_13455 [Sulfuriferula sp.]
MENNIHKVAGIFATEEDTHTARNLLLEHGMSPNHINIIVPDDKLIDKKIEPDGDGVAKTVVKDAFIGSAIGGGVGAAGAAAMAAASITLFVASPVLGPLALMGWGAMVGAFVGAGKGVGIEEDQFADMIKDVTNNGQYVLIVHTFTESEYTQAHDVLAELVQTKADVRAV